MLNNLTVHTIVKNEEQWVWYAVNSVIDYAGQIIIYDTGSVDRTVEIIKSIKSKKIIFEEKGEVSAQELVDLRNQQVQRTKTNWFLLLDGDEVWPKDSIKALVNFLPTLSSEVIGVVVKALLPVSDLFHYQDDAAGRYELLGKKGHYNIRAYRKRDGYKWKGVYPLEAYIDNNGRAINDQDNKLALLSDKPYWHLRHLRRSSVGDKGVKLEAGRTDIIKLPDVFYRNRPDVVPSPWVELSIFEKILALFLTPWRKIKRMFIG